MSTMSPDARRYVDSVAADLAAVGDACRRHRDRTVPTCPDWTGADLLAHLTSYTRWLVALFDDPRGLAAELPAVDRDEAVRDWDATARDLVAALRDRDPSETVPNWSSTAAHTAAFWLRRTAQDVAIHRVDAARLDTPEPDPVPADIAADGVHEYVDVFVTTAFATGTAPERAATLRIELTDTGDARQVDLPHPGPVTTLRGTASDVLQGLWHRRDLPALVTDGDHALVAAWPRI